MSDNRPVIEIHLRLRRRHLFAMAALVVAAPMLLLAGSVTGLTSFSNGAVANADAVNGNFAAIEDAVNDNEARISALLAPRVWNNMVLMNGWQHHGNGYGTAQYSKDAAGTVCLRGLVQSGSAHNAVVANLPVGFRPARSYEFSAAISGGVPGEVIVLSNGNVYFESGNTAWSSFDGICFHTS